MGTRSGSHSNWIFARLDPVKGALPTATSATLHDAWVYPTCSPALLSALAALAHLLTSASLPPPAQPSHTRSPLPVTSGTTLPHLLPTPLFPTRSSTLWYLDLPHLSRVPLVCGHGSDIQSLAASPQLPGLFASTALDGVLRVWRMGGPAAVEAGGEGDGQATVAPEPVVEFQR